ncbi:MAG: UDP-N-acetylmuramoyl-tripeptide--D-alanyl-D-alanine ligase [Gemmatimonadetes bacterium]|nr:UDP-N-acetylmuramoyl-tripeptide--D-alanyl-D-alanine ligase [Gemmatimonadota bacterium]
MPESNGARGVRSEQPAEVHVTAQRVSDALGEPVLRGSVQAFSGISIDSRTVGLGELFFALRGERQDGNAFVARAVEAGAAGVVAAIAPPPDVAGCWWWPAPEGVAALQRLALAHRLTMPARVVCVTGSNGKTSTKELIAAVLATAHAIVRTPGNLNSQVGLPLSLLRLRPDHAWGVFEVGTSTPGEIATLAAVARPDVGVITNVAPSHLEGLSSIEGVIREKTDLAAALGRRGTLVYGGDGELLRSAVAAFSCDRVSFGLAESNDVHPTHWELDEGGRPVFDVAGAGEIRLRLVGLPNLLNALAAIAVGRLAGLAPAQIRRGLESAEPLSLRLEVARAGGVTVIRDCYNANPDSMRSGVETLRSIAGGGTRVAVLGGMRELGRESEGLHYALGRELGERPVDLLLIFGDEAVPLARGYQATTDAPVHFFRDDAALVRFLGERVAAPATVLFKASRGVALDGAARAYLVGLQQAPSNGAGRR